MKETIEYRGLTIEIHQDEEALHPLTDMDTLGKFVSWHTRYNLGNCKDFNTLDDFNAYIKENRVIMLPLYLLDHSGLSISTNSFNDRWDSGQVGFVFCEYSEALQELGKPNQVKMSAKLRQRVLARLQSEVKIFDYYLRDNVYMYIVKDAAGSRIDSCGGFYPDDDGKLTELLAEAKSVIDHHCKTHIPKTIITGLGILAWVNTTTSR